jgi:Mg/Co/Ni transporter MgtE
MTRQRAEWPFRGGAEDRLAVFLRGLVVGAIVGAVLAGAALARRSRSR